MLGMSRFLSSRKLLAWLWLSLSFTNGFQYTRLFGKPIATSLAMSTDRIVVALTREDGKNQKLINQIKSNPGLDEKVELLELPCIEHADGPDFDKLGETLLSKEWEYVVVTSPEAARVVASAWDVVKENPPSVCAVGKATEQTLEKHGIVVSFTPSKATAKTLAAELEFKGEGTCVLYPASARAQKTLENGLNDRGFSVTRLNTYDTVVAEWSDIDKEKAANVQVACFASPSSIKGWLSNTNDNKNVMAACIGETSGEACRKTYNWRENQIFYPESPGLEGWVESIEQAVDQVRVPHNIS